MTDDTSINRTLDELYKVIESRKGRSGEESYTAKLFEEGIGTITRKIGEEATEVIIAALRETPEQVTAESADLLYHLLVLWAEQGIRPEDVMAELEGRTGTSGIEEKAARE